MSFVKNRQGYLVSETERQCTNCRSMFPNTSKTVTLCPACNTARVKSQSAENKMLARAKARSRQSGIECTITLEDIKIPETCPILGIPLVCHSGTPGGRENSPALDRKDNSKGYTPDNVLVISHMANMMKSSASPEMLQRFGQWAVGTYGTPNQGSNES